MRDLKKRLLHGGLPETLLADKKEPEFYAEWMDSYFARDLQELFRVDKRHGFFRLVEALMRQSGALLEVTQMSKACGISRPTVMSYLEILQQTYLLHWLRPYHGRGKQELLRQPKVYGFDTGFVSHYLGWADLRAEDCGRLWEHLVLEFLLAHYPPQSIYFWRDKQQHEVDFIVRKPRAG